MTQMKSMPPIPPIPVKGIQIPTPSKAIEPTPEAVAENSQNVCAPEPEETQGEALAEPFQYVNDLDEAGKIEFVQPLIRNLKEKLAKPTLSANDVAKCLNFTHTRITRNFPNGTKLSHILANLPKPRSIDPDKLLGRLSEASKKELLAKLQQELA